jgi:hypothetical protein
MRKPLPIVLFVLGLVALAAPRFAAAQESLLAHVPFPFVAEGKLLPAGDYRVVRSDMPEHVIQVISRDGRNSTFVEYEGLADTGSRGAVPTLQFQKIDGQYLLWRVGVPGTGVYNITVGNRQAEERMVRAALRNAGEKIYHGDN